MGSGGLTTPIQAHGSGGVRLQGRQVFPNDFVRTRFQTHAFPASLGGVIGARTFLSALARWSAPMPAPKQTGGQECPRSLRASFTP